MTESQKEQLIMRVGLLGRTASISFRRPLPVIILRSMAVILIILVAATPCRAASKNLKMIPEKALSVDDIRRFAKEQFSYEANAEKSEWQANKEALEAGWNAFNVNFGVQGGAFTIFEEFLSMGFLQNINEMCGKIGGGLILAQLAIDLTKGDLAAANINLAKGSLGYAIGKWGTRGMKAGATAALAVELFLTDFAQGAFETHNEFVKSALRTYFLKKGGYLPPKRWVQLFENARNGSGVEDKQDIRAIVDMHVASFWSFDNLAAAISEHKKGAGGFLDKGTSNQLFTKKAYFQNYVKAQIIYPYLQSIYHSQMVKHRDQMARMALENMKKLYGEMNRVYTLEGMVRGPKEKIKGLLVHIPGVVDGQTDQSGRFRFQFTLYSLVRQLSPGQGLMIELRVPKKDGYDFIQKSGKITAQHRKTGKIRVLFNMAEPDPFWQECLRKKLLEDPFFCRLYRVTKTSYARLSDEPSIFWQKNPYRLQKNRIKKYMAKYRLAGKSLDRDIEKLGNAFGRVFDKEREMLGNHRVGYMRAHAARCGNCRIEKKSRPSVPGVSDRNYNFVCMNDRTGQFETNIDSVNCEIRYHRVSDWKYNPFTDQIVAQINEHFRLSNLSALLQEMKKCGCSDEAYREFVHK
jgi:hypothetical protein